MEQFSNEPSEKIQLSFGLGYPYDPDPSSKILAPFGGAVPGSHALSNGNFSASRPLGGTVKMELPSLQYPETDLNSWLTCPSPPPEEIDTYIQSPPTTVLVRSECVSPRNSGLLEALLHEAQARKNQQSEKSLSSAVTQSDMVESLGFNLWEAEWEEHNDPISPLGRPAASVFSECTPPFSGGSLDELQPSKAPSCKHHCALKFKPFFIIKFKRFLKRQGHSDIVPAGSDIMVAADKHVLAPNMGDRGILPSPFFLRPDALLEGSDWLENSEDAKEHSTLNDKVVTLVDEDFCSEYKQLPTGMASALAQRLDLDSYP